MDLSCRFGGDGRAASAGIDQLPDIQINAFVDAFLATPWDNAERTGVSMAPSEPA